MSQAKHYQFQADQAKRLARQVSDAEVRERLLEMAGEYSRYAELMEAREQPREHSAACVGQRTQLTKIPLRWPEPDFGFRVLESI
jgi:hypothetical protein